MFSGMVAVVTASHKDGKRRQNADGKALARWSVLVCEQDTR